MQTSYSILGSQTSAQLEQPREIKYKTVWQLNRSSHHGVQALVREGAGREINQEIVRPKGDYRNETPDAMPRTPGARAEKANQQNNTSYLSMRQLGIIVNDDRELKRRGRSARHLPPRFPRTVCNDMYP